MKAIPNAPSWDFAIGFCVATVLFIIMWIVIEWIARGK